MELADRPADAPVRTEHFDVLIVGAGLSGIAAAYHLHKRSPRKTFAILEGRDAIGGTWDLFRYPGVRSDSDMHTLGYAFRPWHSDKSIVDGASILSYVRDTAATFGIDRKIRLGQSATRATWSSTDALWTIEVSAGAEKTPLRYTCSFLFMCSGYYDYAAGYTPQWPDMDRFRGRLVHPQQWPEGLDYAGKRVVLIGSGATAVTLAPELAKTAAHVSLLQRSPTYVVARPATDPIAKWAQARLPRKLGGALVRWKNVLFGMYFYGLSRRKPDKMKADLIALVRRQLGHEYDVETHFTPNYDPWDQRMCLVPDADLFAAIKSGNISVVTGHIERFTESGLRLKSGEEIEADVIVTATGLKMQLMGGMQIVVDGVPLDLAKSLMYKGTMYSDVPNLAAALGYTNASWTLKCELSAAYVCRLLNFMDRRGYAYCMPRRDESSITEVPALELTSGYVLRAEGILPKQGSRTPWRVHQNYVLDLAMLRFGKLADRTLQFERLEGRRNPLAARRRQPARAGR